VSSPEVFASLLVGWVDSIKDSFYPLKVT